MGLLDDAIREHLELKRRGGADPGEIASKEQEALDPVFPDEPSASADGVGSLPDPGEAPLEAGHVDELPPEDHGLPMADAADFSRVGQETAELDMQAVLDEQSEPSAGPSPAASAGASPVRASQSPVVPEQDSLEREVPGDSEGGLAPQNIPGQERLTFE
jgi:hypothetical protein